MLVDETNIIVGVDADLARGTVNPEQVTCVQYDAELRVIAVRLKQNGLDWNIPDGYSVNVRMKKADGTSVYNPQQGEGNVAYITLSAQMCGVVGTQYFVVEIVKGEDVAQTVPIRLQVIKNPIENKDFTSEDEDETIQKAIQDAVDAAEAAKTSQTAAAQSASSAASSANSATGLANSAYGYMQNASQSATNAANSATAAKTAQTAAEAAQTAAETAQGAAEAAAQNAKSAEEALENVYTKTESDARYAPISAAIRPTVSGNPIFVQDSVAWPLQSLVLHGKTTQDGTPSPDNPVPLVSAGDEGQIDVTVCGANILFANIKKPTGMEVECDENGIITITGAPGEDRDVHIIGDWANKEEIYPNGDKTVYLEGLTEDETIYIRTTNNTTGYKGGKEIKILSAILGIIVRLKDGKTYNDLQIKPMINFGSTALPFEPYTGKTITISIPNGLPGIPVDSGGNYTDSDGQQWICDEIDIKSGKHIKKVKKMVFNGSESWVQESNEIGNRYKYYFGEKVKSSDKTIGTTSMNSNFPLGDYKATWNTKNVYTIGNNEASTTLYVSLNGTETLEEFKSYLSNNNMTVSYIPAEIQEEENSYEELSSQNGATTAYTTADTDLTMQYVADAQKYIDNKIGAISAAMLKE